MSVEHLKSPNITNLDAIPRVPNTAGAGAAGEVQYNDGYATVSALASVLSTYLLTRFPSNARVKSVIFEAEAMGAGKFQLGVYYSDATNDGTSVPNQGLVVASAVDFFASDIDCASAVTRAGYTNQNGKYTVDKRTQPIWQALGLATDPGGFFDLVATVHTTAVTTGAARIAAAIEYIV